MAGELNGEDFPSSLSLNPPLESYLTYSLDELSRLLRNPSPLDHFGKLKHQIFEDILDIYEKDIEHCDKVWPLGNHDNGALYKVYAENWRLKVELEKHRRVVEQLKRQAFEQQISEKKL